jgi:hypothetical protein
VLFVAISYSHVSNSICRCELWKESAPNGGNAGANETGQLLT